MPVRPLRLLLLITAGALAACSSGTVAAPRPPEVTGATVVSQEPARNLCSGTPATGSAPTARHTVVSPPAVGRLRKEPETTQTRKVRNEYEVGLIGSGQTLRLLTTYGAGTVQVKVAVLSAGAGEYGAARLAFLCRSATGYVAADVTALRLPGFADELLCFQDPAPSKPVLCAWYDDTAGTLNLTGARGAAALDLAVSLREALERPTS